MRKLFLVLGLVLCFTNLSRAQFFQHNHPELEWQSFDTEHFTIHFHQGTKRTAMLVSKIAEEIYPGVTSVYNFEPNKKTHFVIKDTDDYSNGGAFFLDSKVEIWAANLDYIMRGTKNWLRDVVTHEFTHMISIQAMIKSNKTIPYGFVQLFGYEKERRKDVVRGFPNTLMIYPISSINIPVWFAEGTAQHQVDGNRYDYRDPHREMILRDRILNDELLTYNDMTVFGKCSHGNESSYNLGFSFVDYLTDRFGEDVLAEITANSSKWNAYTFEGVLKKSTGVKPEVLYNEWKDSLTAVYKKRTSRITETLVKGKALETSGTANIYPEVSADGTKIAWVSNSGEDYFSINRLVVLDRQTAKKKVISGLISSSLSWSPDSRYLIYARQDDNKYGSAYNDLYIYDFEKEKETRLTRYLRGSNPDFSSDGKKVVFVSATNGLHQLNVYHLPDAFTEDYSQTAYFDIETGRLENKAAGDEKNLRKVEYKGGKIEQLLVFENERQIYHPRWSNDDSQIVFDTAIEYGRNLGVYDLVKREYAPFITAEEELRYPYFQPDSPYLYYAASSTGIYNIYRRNLQNGQTELLTNVTGGAMMPALDKDGRMVYACYDSVGYHIYAIDEPAALDPADAVYDPEYIESIPEKNFDNTLAADPEIRPYKQTFTDVHFLPRLFIDYGTVKPGFYVFSTDVLDKYSLVAGAAVNSDLDYDLYGYFEIKEFKPTLFIEAFNMAANIKNDTLSISRGGYSLNYKRDINFNLSEVHLGVSGRLYDKINYRAAYIWSRYNAKIQQKSLYDPIKNVWEIPFTFHYNYLKGHAFQWSLGIDAVKPSRNKAINPDKGRQVFFKHVLESSDFLEDFALNATGIDEIYKNYTFNRFELDWEEYFKNPLLKDHAFSVRLRAGYVDRKVDSFFHLFAGGLLGMKGYSFYSMEGRHKLISTFTYRFPLWQDIDALFGHIYLDKIYLGLFYDYGNAWVNSDRLRIDDFKRDIGFQLRMDSFSYSLFPTRFFAEAVYSLDEARNLDQSNNTIVSYPKEWRFYFGALYEFDLRERMGKLMRLPGNLF